MLPNATPTEPPEVLPQSDRGPKAAARWGKRLGIVAFLFFLIKGLAWLIVPVAVAYAASR